jgi:hypothetical protein
MEFSLVLYSVRVSLLSSEIYKGDDTHKDRSELSQELPLHLCGEVSLKCGKRK